MRVLVFALFAVVCVSDARAEWWCGASGSPLSSFIPDQPTVNLLRRGRTVDFRGSCMRHDVCYSARNNDKRFCNDQFYGEMKSKCDSEFGKNKGEHANCLEWANMFRSAVRSSLGEKAYRDAQSRHRSGTSNPPVAGGVWVDESARRPWNPTGVHVPNGSNIEIQAQGRAAIDTDGAFASPDGSGRGNANATSLLAGAPLHSLICKVGSSRAFYVGNSYKGVVNGEGQLACGMNEQPAIESSYRDNGGGWRLLVKF